MNAVFAAAHLESVRSRINKAFHVRKAKELRVFWMSLGTQYEWEQETSNRMWAVAVEAAKDLGLERLYQKKGYVV